ISANDQRIGIKWPKPLVDIATRWRMFYFHYYMSVALEGMFAWLVTQVASRGVSGASIAGLTQQLSSIDVRKALSDVLGFNVGTDFGKATMAELFRRFVGPFETLDSNTGRLFDERIRPTDSLSEDELEAVIRKRTYLHSPTGLAVSLILLALTL